MMRRGAGSDRYFPVLREKTGNFGENGRFEAKNVTRSCRPDYVMVAARLVLMKPGPQTVQGIGIRAGGPSLQRP